MEQNATEPPDETIFDTIRKTIPPMHPEGWKFVALFALGTFLLSLVSHFFIWPCVILTAWCAYFFRDPVRVVPSRLGLLVSPADGLVHKIVSVVPPEALNLGASPRIRISIFLNVFNVHVNRIPMAGTVTALHYHPGKFLNASLDKASEENERQFITVEIDGGVKIGVVQIAGFVARRILCTLKTGQQVATGERLGLIRFGSRVDVFLPEGAKPLVIVGQTAVGGETILADLTNSERAREGVGI
jgi:phosphatidylserine decarboxylase